MEIHVEDFIEVTYGDEHEGFILIQELPTTVERKYQVETYVVMHLESRKFYSYSVVRTGDDFNGWEYEWGEGTIVLTEVKLMPVTAFEWVPLR